MQYVAATDYLGYHPDYYADDGSNHHPDYRADYAPDYHGIYPGFLRSRPSDHRTYSELHAIPGGRWIWTPFLHVWRVYRVVGLDACSVYLGLYYRHHPVTRMESLQPGAKTLGRVRYTSQGSVQPAGVASLPVVFPVPVTTRQAPEGCWSTRPGWGYIRLGQAVMEAGLPRVPSWQTRSQGASR